MSLHAITYAAPMQDFLIAARQAAQQLTAPVGGAWQLDGFKSDKLFLRLSSDQPARYPGTLDAEFDLESTDEAVTISVFTRLPSQVTFFERFTQQLDLILPRSQR